MNLRNAVQTLPHSLEPFSYSVRFKTESQEMLCVRSRLPSPIVCPTFISFFSSGKQGFPLFMDLFYFFWVSGVSFLLSFCAPLSFLWFLLSLLNLGMSWATLATHRGCLGEVEYNELYWCWAKCRCCSMLSFCCSFYTTQLCGYQHTDEAACNVASSPCCLLAHFPCIASSIFIDCLAPLNWYRAVAAGAPCADSENCCIKVSLIGGVESLDRKLTTEELRILSEGGRLDDASQSGSNYTPDSGMF